WEEVTERLRSVGEGTGSVVVRRKGGCWMGVSGWGWWVRRGRWGWMRWGMGWWMGGGVGWERGGVGERG
ncbi:hypothetical protein, partial [Cellulosimicrobium sp. TH-20]|uniref:hypothetical protein n=1 Tax=Cellulosimicrobium sp. TH-20 TaxID=1980001 RepID=UPI001C93088A